MRTKIIAAFAALLMASVASAAIVSYTTTQTPDGQTNTIIVSWTPLLNGDTGQAAAIGTYADRTVQVSGTFGAGGSVQIEGSNDGVTYATLSDGSGVAIVKTSAGVSLISENPRYIRPRVTAGDGTTSITVTILGKRT
jgi:hypothetical protein